MHTNSVTINVESDAEAEGQNGDLASNEFWTVNESYASLKSALTSLSSAEPNNTILQQAVANPPDREFRGALQIYQARRFGFHLCRPQNN